MLIFSKIAETGGLSQTAREMRMTPSAVSKNLSHLEEQLGVLLVRRTTRSVTLTRQGKIFYERVAQILANVEETFDEVKELGTRVQGELAVTCSIAFGCTQLVGIVQRYSQTYPDVNVQISLEDRLVNLGEESCDIALRITDATDSPYAARKLSQIKWVCCASPMYLERYGRPQTPIALSGLHHKLLVYPEMTNSGGWDFWHKGERVRCELGDSLWCNSSLALRDFALAGYGIACLPLYVAQKEIGNRRLETLFPGFEPARTHTLYAMYFQSRYKNPVIRSFIDFVVRDIAATGEWAA